MLISFLRYLHFGPKILVIKENELIKKLWLTSKRLTSETGRQTIVIQILPNVLRSKGN